MLDSKILVCFCCKINYLSVSFDCRLLRPFSCIGNNESTNRTNFGFQNVSEMEKEQKVYGVFKNVAKSYDLMNDIMSGGIHRLWKDHFMWSLFPVPGTKLVDVAGGTGDIAIRFHNFVRSQQPNNDKGDKSHGNKIKHIGRPEHDLPHMQFDQSLSTSRDFIDISGSDGNEQLTHVTVCDINEAMLDVGKEKASVLGITSGFVELKLALDGEHDIVKPALDIHCITEKIELRTRISWVCGNAEDLPFSENSFDAYTIAFGIRNCTDISQVIREAYRVLRPGGRFMCLEFSHVTNPLLRRIYDSYSFNVIPVMGQIIARDWKSYQYLVESIRLFPDQEEFSAIIGRCGFKMVTCDSLMRGITAVHSGFKLNL